MNAIPNIKNLFYSKYRITSHILFWLAYIFYSGLIYKFEFGFGSGYNFIFVFIIDVLTIYFCTSYLVSKVLVTFKKTKIFIFYFGLIIAFNFLLNFVLQNFIFGSPENTLMAFIEKQLYSLQLSLVFISAAACLKLLKQNQISQQKLSELEKTTVTTELDFLKTQINPHFLFNVLNNTYIQTRIDPKKSGEMILKLSDLLRYQLYECSGGKVMLKSEIEYINNYVDLQKMRTSNLDLVFTQNGTYKGLMIYPFLFLPFLENSFKHGISSKGVENFIHINVDIVEKYVIFAVKNSKNDTVTHNLKPEGFGLVNIKQRLLLLYPKNYELKIEDRENYFNVELKINLE